jgi:hypothetical protein
METFVIRIWTPAEPEDDPEGVLLRGFAEHVRSSERIIFVGSSELVAFLEITVDRHHNEMER